MHDEGTVRARFWAKVDKSAGPDGCWPWTAYRKPNGYGQFGIDRKRRGAYAHRVSYEIAHGRPIPKGRVIDHLCRNRACVNPAHMEVVTQRENIKRGLRHTLKELRKASHCGRGHEFTPANTSRRKDGQRQCRACRNEDARAFRARRKKQALLP